MEALAGTWIPILLYADNIVQGSGTMLLLFDTLITSTILYEVQNWDMLSLFDTFITSTILYEM